MAVYDSWTLLEGTVCQVDKDLRQISLPSTLSKLVEGFMVEISLKPVVLITLDPSQYGFIAGSSTTFALISMFHHWLSTTGRH
ncbi:hypothetical protein P5673_022563 [Acropora cervicornis]|uniref:Uncharacterized protein n=1 Tax=Acropora cervicornis TaxID=6130 RepID=A0AAD9UZQ1_ACRCE|nr:hypothetical protein P5673_022563 [Acropora cervicornis]